MEKRFYVDTSVWRDYFEDRSDGLRPLGMFAFDFLKQCVENDSLILYSDLVVMELGHDYSSERIGQMFAPFNENILRLEISAGQISEAKRLSLEIKGAHYADILHALVARDNRAVMVSRDGHFQSLTGIVEVLLPEEVIFD
ncbi:MAG: hypothetical protein HY394_06150 [Candidatus Diapherotrites archaeon]|nr:hypothetical protein [Candidatus Diapherotrites archaeon]